MSLDENEKNDEIFTFINLEEENKKNKNNMDGNSTWKELLNMLIYIGIVVIVSFLLITYVGQRTRVSGPSMMNTLHDGDNLIIDKISYRFKDPERFDIIVFNYLYKQNTHYIKRIIGLPGETVQIIDSTIYINGEPLEEDYGLEPILAAKRASDPITLGEDEYFVLGDNRNNSSDSRELDVGNVKRDQIVGKAWLRIWPLDQIGFIKHE